MPDSKLQTPLDSIPGAISTRLDELASQLSNLTQSQREWVTAVIGQFQRSATFWRNDGSLVVTPLVLETLGDALRIHHAFSLQAQSAGRPRITLRGATKT